MKKDGTYRTVVIEIAEETLAQLQAEAESRNVKTPELIAKLIEERFCPDCDRMVGIKVCEYCLPF